MNYIFYRAFCCVSALLFICLTHITLASQEFGANNWGPVLNIVGYGQSNLNGIPGTNNVHYPVSYPPELATGEGAEISRSLLNWYGMSSGTAIAGGGGWPGAYHVHRVRYYGAPPGEVYGPELFMLWNLRNQGYATIYTKVYKGGSPIEDFIPPDSTAWGYLTNYYATTQNESANPVQIGVDAIADIGPIDVLIWGQGESGARTNGTYYNHLTNIIETIKSTYNSPNMKTVFMGMNRVRGEDPAHQSYEAEQAFLRYVSEKQNSARYVYTKDLSLRGDHDEDPEGFNVHYNRQGLRDIGIRIAGAIVDLYNDSPAQEFSINLEPQDLGDSLKLKIEFQGHLGWTYNIQYRDSLKDEWTTVSPHIIAPVDGVQWIDSGPPMTVVDPSNASNRFYRVFETNP